MADFKLTPNREKELEKIAKDLPDADFKKRYGKDWKSVKIATAMNILKNKLGFKEENKMKFKDLRERVRGGKVDPLSKMGKSKLTGQEVQRYYKDNPMAKRAARDATVKKAIELALDLGGSMNYAMKEIEKLKRGLTKNKEVQKALRFANESVNEENLKEGTWRIPSNKRELAVLVDMLRTPYPAVNQRQLNTFMDRLPVGDDELYDDLDEVIYEKNPDGSLKRPLVTLKKWPKVFLNVIAGESLNGRWIKGKTQGNKFKTTHHYFGPDAEMESVEEIKKPKRKSGNIRRGKLMKLDGDIMDSNLEEGFLDRGKVLADVPDPKTGLPIFFIIQEGNEISIVMDRDVSKGVAGSASRGEKLGDYEFTGSADFISMNPGHFKKFMRAIKKVRI